jgi:hypothetical protein
MDAERAWHMMHVDARMLREFGRDAMSDEVNVSAVTPG